MSFDPVAFKNTKHILRAANFLRDLVQKESCYETDERIQSERGGKRR